MIHTKYQKTKKIIRQRKIYLSHSKMQMFIKRAFDIGCSFLCLILLLPVYSLYTPTCLLLRKGRMVREQIIGRYAVVFALSYFEPVIKGKNKKKPSEVHVKTRRNQVFVERMQRFLRSLFNVINVYPVFYKIFIGNMSFVGPKPIKTADYDKLMRWHHLRFSVRPGLTGPWFFRQSDLNEIQEIWMDLKYIRECSFCKDLRLLRNTLSEL